MQREKCTKHVLCTQHTVRERHTERQRKNSHQQYAHATIQIVNKLSQPVQNIKYQPWDGRLKHADA
jgi:hypothetical protein